MTNTQIESAAIHYGFPTVRVTEYATTDRQGNPVIVDTFYRNGFHITAEGYRVRKDGTPYARHQVVNVSVPSEVVSALDSMEVTA